MLRGHMGGDPMEPFLQLQRMQEEMNRLMGAFGPAFGGRPASLAEAAAALAGQGGRAVEYPPVNIWAGEDGLVITAEVPGMGPDGLEITVYRDTLTLKGKREPAAGDEVTWHRRERPVGAFGRTVALPYAVDATKVEAVFKDGTVRITAPRPESDKPKKIKIVAE